MKKLSLLIILLFAPMAAYSQCVATAADPCVSVNQSLLDRTKQALLESKAKDDLIAAYQNLGKLTDFERAAAQAAMKAAMDAFDAQGKQITDMERVDDRKDKLIDALMTLVEKLTAKIDAKKSGWVKFVEAVEKIALIVVGVTIGHGL